jgi:hypothetical protein
MVSIYITTTAQTNNWNHHALDNLNRVLRASQYTLSKKHITTTSLADADIILFVGSRCIYHSDIFNSDIYKQYPDKCLVFDFFDITIPRLPGLYATIPHYLHQFPIYEYGFYIQSFDDWSFVERVDFSKCKYLYSFIGSCTTCPKTRLKILELAHPRSYLKDTSIEKLDYPEYAEILNSSKFILCPRGIGPASIRVFEAMRQGRVPVIISDEWVAPLGIDWEKFSIRVAEDRTSCIPELLEQMEDKAEEMGGIALECWQNNFSVEHSFDWIAEAAVRIQSSRQVYQSTIDRNIYFESFKKQHFANFWKEVVRKKIGKI